MASWHDLEEACAVLGVTVADATQIIRTDYLDQIISGPAQSWLITDTVREALNDLSQRALNEQESIDTTVFRPCDLEEKYGIPIKEINDKIREAELAGVVFEGRINIRTGKVGRPSYIYTEEFLEQFTNYLDTMNDLISSSTSQLPGLDFETTRLLELLQKSNELTLEETADALGISPRQVRQLAVRLQTAGYAVSIDDVMLDLNCSIAPAPANNILPCWEGKKDVYRILAVSDLHAGSPECMVTTMQTAYREAERLGCDFAVFVGDIFDGPAAMHKGFEYRLKLLTLQDQMDWVSQQIPRNMKTYMITGNHDASWIKLAGFDPVRNICASVPEWEWAGSIDAFIQGPNNIPNFLCLHHGMDGSAYARSYKSQKFAEYLTYAIDGITSMMDDNNLTAPTIPQLVLSGHYHKINMSPGPMGGWYFLLPALAGTTDFQRGKALINDMGYTIIEFHIDNGGRIDRIRPDFQLSRGGIEADYSTFAPATKPVISLVPWGQGIPALA